MDLEKVEELYRDILGPFPERVPLNLETLEEEDCGDFTRSLIAWDNDAEERVHGYLLRPKVEEKRPGVLVFHGHGAWELGKKSTAGVDVEGDKPCLGPGLVQRGLVVL